MSDDFTAQFFQHVDASALQYIAELGEAVAIPSVSADLQTHLKDIIQMEEWTMSYIERLGGTAELLPNPKGVDDVGNELPPILLAEFKAGQNSDSKKTVCCYAHLDVQVNSHSIIMYCISIARVLSSLRQNNNTHNNLRLQPAAKEDGWDSDPFVLTEKDGKLYGRGSTDDKGPALSWLWVIQAHRKLGVDLPVNVKFMFEGMEER